MDVDEFILPTGDGELAWMLFNIFIPVEDGCWRLKTAGIDEPSAFAADANEEKEAMVNVGIVCVTADDSADDGTDMTDGDEERDDDIDGITVNVVAEDATGEISKPVSCGEASNLVAPAAWC